MVECLLREGVDFMLVGGYAVALHGWPRTTFDIDFWIMANPENAKAVMRAITAFGAPLMGLTEEDFHRPGMVFQIGNEPQRIDLEFIEWLGENSIPFSIVFTKADKLSRRMDRTAVKMTTLKEQDEAFCLSLTIDERIKVLEELNRIGRRAAGYLETRLDRSIVHAA